MRLLILLAFLLLNPVVYGDPAARVAELIRETAPAPVPEASDFPLQDGPDNQGTDARKIAPPILLTDQRPAAQEFANGTYVFSDPTWCPACPAIDAALETAKADPWMRQYKWEHSPDGQTFGKPNIIVVDRINRVHPQRVVEAMIGDRQDANTFTFSIPAIVRWENGHVVRSWTGVCNRPLDKYTLHWLDTGIDRRPVRYTLQDGGLYPTRSGWWSVDDEWQPSEQYLRDHLIEGPEHADRYDTDWLYELTYAEMMSLHSDAHENRVQWDYVYAPGQYEGVKLMRPPSRSVAATAPKAAPRLQQTCPNGMCPAPGRRR